MRLDELKPAPGSRRERKRVGRGISAGGGKTAGRGQKGQGARSSWSLPRAFEGGQMPLTQRVPKLRGFHNRFRVEYQVVNCGDLARFEADTVVDHEALRKAGLVRHPTRPVKLLADGDSPPRLTLQVDGASRAARRAVEEAGGRIELPEAALARAQAADQRHPRRRRLHPTRALAETAGPAGGQDNSA